MNGLLKVSLRQQAIFIEETIAPASMVVMPLSACTAALVANMVKLGYGVGPALLHALNVASPAMQDEVLATLREVAGVKKNWTPLIKDWHAAEAAAHIHHVMTAFANVFRGADTIVTTLPCGH